MSNDSSKRGKMLFLSFLLTVSFFVLKVMQTRDLTLLEVFGVAGIAFVVSYVGQLIILGRDINRKVLLFIVPQSSLMIFSEILFLQLYFFARFDRAYEAFIVLLILLVFYFAIYVTLLMANIFSIASVKQIPLEQVAKTTSYILTLFSVYFMTFAVLSSSINIILTFVILGLVYVIAVITHLMHQKYDGSKTIKLTIIVALAMLFGTIGGSFIGARPEIMAIIPVAISYAMIGSITVEDLKNLSFITVLQYFLFVIVAYLLNFIIK